MKLYFLSYWFKHTIIGYTTKWWFAFEADCTSWLILNTWLVIGRQVITSAFYVYSATAHLAFQTKYWRFTRAMAVCVNFGSSIKIAVTGWPSSSGATTLPSNNWCWFRAKQWLLVLGMGIQIFLHALEFLFAFGAAAMHRTVFPATPVNETCAEVVSQWIVMGYMVLQKYQILGVQKVQMNSIITIKVHVHTTY